MPRDKIYGITIGEQTKKLNTKKVILLVLLLIVTLVLIMLAKNSVEIIKQSKIYEQYEAQMIALAKQEEDKLAKEQKEEKEKKEKLPQLTQDRKRRDKKYL